MQSLGREPGCRGADGFGAADVVTDVCIAEVRGSTETSLRATPKLLLVYETRFVIVSGSRLESARSSGSGAGVVVSLVSDAVLQVVRAFGRRKTRRAVVAQADAVVLASDSIASVRLTQQVKKLGGRHFVVIITDAAGEETFFHVSTQGSKTLRTSAQLGNLFAAVVGDRFTSDAVDPVAAPRRAQTDRALVVLTGVALTIAVVVTFLPWMRRRYMPIGLELGSPRHTETLRGVGFGWKVTVALGVAVVAFAIGRRAAPRLKSVAQVGMVATALLAIALLYGAINMAKEAELASDSAVRISASPQVGLYVAIVVTVIAVATQVALLNPTKSGRSLLLVFAGVVVFVGASAMQDPVSGSGSSAAGGSANEVRSEPQPALFVESDSGFQAVFPTPPAHDTPSEGGGYVNTYTSVAADGTYSVWVTSGLTPDLKGLEKLAATPLYGRIVSSRVITFQTVPAVESVEFERSTNHFHEHARFVRENRMFDIDVSGHDDPPSGYAKFLASFQLAGPSATGDETPSTFPSTPPPLLGPDSEASDAAGSAALFDDSRARLAALLQAQPDPKLTAYSFDTIANTVSASFVYGHPARESRAQYDAFAWKVGQILSDEFWSPDLVRTIRNAHHNVEFLAKLRLQLDGVTYRCPALVQIAVAADDISQPDWLRMCAG